MPSVLPYSSMQLIAPSQHITQSKIAGKPYLPYKAKLPLTEVGDEMFLLVQLNFAEAHLPIPFPSAGIFQLFIDPVILNDEKINFYQVPEAFYEPRFVTEPFHFEPEILAIQSSPTSSSIRKERGIRFQSCYEPVSFTDYRLPHFIADTDIRLFEQQTLAPFEEIYAQHFLSAENKVGGYPFFIENDIRDTHSEFQRYDTLLFQIVSNEDDHIMIGNYGVIKLLINKQDLLRKDFSDVLLIVEDYT